MRTAATNTSAMPSFGLSRGSAHASHTRSPRGSATRSLASPGALVMRTPVAAREIGADARGVDLAVAVATVDPCDEPTAARPGDRDVAGVALDGGELEVVPLPALLVDPRDVDLGIAVVARHPGDGAAVLGLLAGSDRDATHGERAGRDDGGRRDVPCGVDDARREDHGRVSGVIGGALGLGSRRLGLDGQRGEQRHVAETRRREVDDALAGRDGAHVASPSAHRRPPPRARRAPSR